MYKPTLFNPNDDLYAIIKDEKIFRYSTIRPYQDNVPFLELYLSVNSIGAKSFNYLIEKLDQIFNRLSSVKDLVVLSISFNSELTDDLAAYFKNKVANLANNISAFSIWPGYADIDVDKTAQILQVIEGLKDNFSLKSFSCNYDIQADPFNSKLKEILEQNTTLQSLPMPNISQKVMNMLEDNKSRMTLQKR